MSDLENDTLQHLICESSTSELILAIGSTYLVEFEKPGYYSKKVKLNLNISNKWIVGSGYLMPSSMSMIKVVDGLSLPMLSEPMSECRYNESENLFEWDFERAVRIRDEVDEALRGAGIAVPE